MDGRLLSEIRAPGRGKWWNVEDDIGRREVMLQGEDGKWYQMGMDDVVPPDQLRQYRAVCEIELGGK